MLRYILTALLVLVVAGCAQEANNDALAQCLTDKGAVMYGAEWCSHCQAQKKDFGSSFDFINFVDCDAQKDACIAAGVRGYPTWIIGGQLYEGTQRLDRLAEIAGC